LQRCAVKKTSADPNRRSVNDTPGGSGSSARGGDTGDDREGNAAPRRASISSLTRPKTAPSPPFRRTTCLPGRSVGAQPPIDFLLCHLSLVVALADALDARRRRDQLEDLRREQIVVQDDVGLTEDAQGFQRQQFRIAGTAPTR
jgi:hypothetical protein